MQISGLIVVLLVGSNLCLADISYKTERKLGTPIRAAEAGASCCMGNLVAFGVPALISMALESPAGGIPGYVLFLYPVIYPFASAFSIDIAGRTCRQRGSFWGAVGGGVVGMICSGLMFVYVPGISEFKPIPVAAFVIVPPVISVTGYNVFAGSATRGDGAGDRSYGQVLRGMHSSRDDLPTWPSIRLKLLELDF